MPWLLLVTTLGHSRYRTLEESRQPPASCSRPVFSAWSLRFRSFSCFCLLVPSTAFDLGIAAISARRRLEAAFCNSRPEFSIFYFAGRPVAQLKEVDTTSAFTYLTTDHLGTPLLATDEAGVDVWAGPFDPFGGDTFGQALESDVFLRLPGQWADSLWQGASSGADVYYNVHRWYQYGTGRYGRVDPLGYDGSPLNWYLYAEANPTHFGDFLGLTSFEGFDPGRRQQMEESCGEVTGFGFFTNTVKIGPAAFGPGCGCSLSALLTHEVNHLTWGNFIRPPGRSRERPSYDLETDCFGCPPVFDLVFPPAVRPPGSIFGGK